MTTAIQCFDFEENPARFFTRADGVVCGITADLGRLLNMVNVRKLVASFPEDEKGVTKGDTLGGAQDISYLTEPGIYRLIFRSNKPEAERFRRWVFHEVLPAIRQTGRFAVGEPVAAPEEENALPTGLAAICYPVTIPEYLSSVLCMDRMPFAEIIRFGDRVRRAGRSFGVPFALKAHSSFGLLRAYPAELCAYVLASLRNTREIAAETQVGDLLSAMEPGIHYTLAGLADLAIERGIFSAWLSPSTINDHGTSIKLGRILHGQEGHDHGGLHLRITGSKNARRYTAETQPA